MLFKEEGGNWGRIANVGTCVDVCTLKTGKESTSTENFAPVLFSPFSPSDMQVNLRRG